LTWKGAKSSVMLKNALQVRPRQVLEQRSRCCLQIISRSSGGRSRMCTRDSFVVDWLVIMGDVVTFAEIVVSGVEQ